MVSYQKGNVLFLILIAVALFAALSYAVTQSSRSGGGNAGIEKTQLIVNQMNQYGSELASAITRVMLSNGCSLNTIDFDSDNWQNNEYDISSVSPYESSPANNSCDIFAANGGGVIWRKPPKGATPTATDDYGFMARIWVQDVGTTLPELTLVLNVTRDVCLSVNNRDGVSSGGAFPYQGDPNSVISTPLQNWKAFGRWLLSTGGDRFVPNWPIGGGTSPTLKGHQMGCFETNAGAGIYTFYQVLVIR